MSIGKVTVWQMTEEERLAYIAKHPIVPTEKPKGVAFSDIHSYGERTKKVKKEGIKIIDTIDKGQLHKLFLLGKSLREMAHALGISETTIHKYIKEQRIIDPEKWPYRSKK
jgi:DNA invertase Pin-like site-specific DNA recombinase